MELNLKRPLVVFDLWFLLNQKLNYILVLVLKLILG